MAVKAKDQVTIVDVTDIQSVTIYYLLQATTLAAPSSPTTASPSGWTTTEPSYSGDSTQTLYTCVKTLWHDGSFTWGSVNVSSSYEAAKAAWNKADNAQTIANNNTINIASLATRVSNAEIKLTDTALITTISKSLNGGTDVGGSTGIRTTKFVMDSNGLLIKNGALTIQNNAGTTVFSADTNGNLTITGSLNLKTTQSLNILNGSSSVIGSLKWEAITWQGSTFDTATLSSNTNINIKVGSTNNNVACQTALYTGSMTPVLCGQRATGSTWVDLFAAKNGATQYGGVYCDADESPVVRATGCTVSSAPSAVNGYDLNGSWIRKNGMGNLIVLHLQVYRVNSAGGNVCCGVLPAGFRPSSKLNYTAFEAASGAMQEVQLWPDGQIVLWNNQRSPTYIYKDFVYYL
jgi:hypothetical protein